MRTSRAACAPLFLSQRERAARWSATRQTFALAREETLAGRKPYVRFGALADVKPETRLERLGPTILVGPRLNAANIATGALLPAGRLGDRRYRGRRLCQELGLNLDQLLDQIALVRRTGVAGR